jgi:hypothetical protein
MCHGGFEAQQASSQKQAKHKPVNAKNFGPSWRATLVSNTASKGLSPLKVGFFFFGCVFAMTMISQQKLPEAIGFGLLAGVLAYWVRSREISSDE